MENLDRYLKIAKNVVIKPQENNIEEKIIKKLSSINDRDKSMLDANFLEYLKKSNSRLYLFSDKVRNNPGKFAVLGLFIALSLGCLAYILKNTSAGKSALPSSKNNS
jgi:hypothetical protein